jgi:hypothetical protein
MPEIFSAHRLLLGLGTNGAAAHPIAVRLREGALK